MSTFCHGRQIDQGDGRGQAGFTVVELLISIITIGILAAIVLPSFVSHRKRADDASARTLVANGALALQAHATDHDHYAATRDDILAMAPSLRDARDWSLDTSPTGFALSVTSASQHVFRIQRSLTGAAVRTCTTGPDPAGTGGCSPDGTW